ncbi:amino acid transporter [Cladorrhinum sp. PSN259]|nr:amino acid transporter [Cladorrhinum sp. PSN259]
MAAHVGVTTLPDPTTGAPGSLENRAVNEAATQPQQEIETLQTLRDTVELVNAQDTAAKNPTTQLINRSLDGGDLHGRFTVASLIVNRTVASGIFTQPHNVVTNVGNAGASLLVWFVAGVIIQCVTACWVELGLSIPRHVVRGRHVSTPRSGGDKNYLEYIYKKPDLLMSCVFGITFIVFGNLAGNAIQLGVYMQAVVNPSCQRNDCVKSGPVVAWAIGALTLCALFNVGTRKFSIQLNNTFAVLKLAVVIIMIFVGLGYGSTHGDGCRQIIWENKGEGGAIGDIILALFYAIYPYTGYEQPFYVLSEVKQPKTLFSKSVMYTMTSFIALYMLINTSYLCMNPYLGPASLSTASPDFPTNAGINFFYTLSSGSQKRNQGAVVQGVSFVLALFIFGNLLAQTYTASRVKQEIAKEGILPYSLWFAKSHDTLYAWLSRRGNTSNGAAGVEQAPFAATLLHWAFEVLLVLIFGLLLPPKEAYNFLTYIYTFIIVGILGFLTVCGLLYLKIDAWLRPEPRAPPSPRHVGRGWNGKHEWYPWLDPLPCVVAVLALGFLIFGAFARPSSQPDDEFQWWVKPLVGWCSLFVGIAWWVVMEVRQRRGAYRIQRDRVTFVEAPEDEDPVQTAELVIVKKIYASERRGFNEGLSGV